MLKLHYIILHHLPERETAWIQNNIGDSKTDAEQEKKAAQVSGTGQTRKTERTSERTSEREVCRLLLAASPEEIPWKQAAESLLVTDDTVLLQKAADCHMAAICYRQPTDTLPESVPTADAALAESGRGRQSAASEHRTAVNVMPTNDAKAACAWCAEGFEDADLTFFQHVYERYHGIPWTILTTERCVVKEFSMEYLDALFELYAGEGMTDYVEPLYSYEKEREYQQAYIENMYRFYGYGMWIVCDKKTGKLIGRAGLECREELEGELELGYAIGKPYQRRGYAAEVCGAILNYAKEELDAGKVCCLIRKDNRASVCLAKKLGFAYAGEQTAEGVKYQKYEILL